MKKTLLLFLLGTTLAIGQSKKDNYIKEHFPLLLENLSSEDLQAFKSTMKMSSKNKLKYIDSDLLRKGSGDQFGVYYQIFSFDRTGVRNRVTIIDEENREIVIEEDGTISFDNTLPLSQIDSAAASTTQSTFTTFEGKTYDLADLLTRDGVFLITSTTCGPCMLAYGDLNQLASDPAYQSVPFTALFINSAANLKTYTEGTVYKNFGLLETPWELFTSADLISHLIPNYNVKSKTVPYILIKKNNKVVYSSNRGIKIDQIKKNL
ncbi:hypothetical protein [Myroides sp. DF42-4-2]|uniref:TlpA family protein disulfide reductase n=1 Tax=unclassified Myroides TaxID=2642485 RepID=UPI002578602B|nr:hypothetical protein [Myroides sp. DF42-4-2]MDM1407882.1 hypothetical protein [Myroides sp. DF42-4-2]